MSFAEDLLRILTERVPCDDPDSAHVVSLSSDGQVMVTLHYGGERLQRTFDRNVLDRDPEIVAGDMIEDFIGPPRPPR